MIAIPDSGNNGGNDPHLESGNKAKLPTNIFSFPILSASDICRGKITGAIDSSKFTREINLIESKFDIIEKEAKKIQLDTPPIRSDYIKDIFVGVSGLLEISEQGIDISNLSFIQRINRCLSDSYNPEINTLIQKGARILQIILCIELESINWNLILSKFINDSNPTLERAKIKLF